MNGSGETLMRALTPFLGDFQVQFFGSMRMVADMGDDEKIQAVVSGGVVDRQFHANQKDQLPAWTEGRLLTWWFSPQQVEAHARRRQELVPKQASLPAGLTVHPRPQGEPDQRGAPPCGDDLATMPWSLWDYPASMRHLGAAARAKAIEIANALLAEGMEEGKAIRIAIAQAKRWAAAHGLPARDDD